VIIIIIIIQATADRTDRSVCVSKGSSVNISCTYNSYYKVTSKFWFRPERGPQWKNPSQSEDLRTDSQRKPGSTVTLINIYKHRVIIICSHQYSDPSIRPSVLVSPSEIVEGISVTLTCSSDTNPAAKYTWYKRNQSLPLSSGDIYHFTSISSEDRGIYYCKSEDHYSVDVFVDVQYPPNLPSVSVSPSEIVEGSSVNLTCSSDANPAANYTWYKENEESPKASGQIFTITDIRAEHSGIYYCEVQNIRGRHNSTLHLTLSTGTFITFKGLMATLESYIYRGKQKSKSRRKH
uniref:Ig-like domain-containing protein n=1 Tax=Anabas testudineus TaxID=64144 RepID=A0A3Q1JA76_ANATE